MARHERVRQPFVAGHLIECSNYVCGGNFTGFKALEHSDGDGWTNIGYPIAEISAEGDVVIQARLGAIHGTNKQLR
jgi:hypothetical protein